MGSASLKGTFTWSACLVVLRRSRCLAYSVATEDIFSPPVVSLVIVNVSAVRVNNDASDNPLDDIIHRDGEGANC